MGQGESVLIPLGIILLGLLGLTIYCLTMALTNAVRKLAEMNERLMILVGAKEGDDRAARALVASAKRPKKTIPGVASKKESKKEPPKGYRMTVGVR